MLRRIAGPAVLVALALPALALGADDDTVISLVRNYRPGGSGPTISQIIAKDVLPFFAKTDDSKVIGWSARPREHGWYVVIFTIRVIEEDFNYVFAVNPNSDPVVVNPVGDMAESLWP